MGIPKKYSVSVLLEENQMSGVIGWATEINLGIPTGVSKRDKTPLKKIKVFIFGCAGSIAGP